MDEKTVQEEVKEEKEVVEEETVTVETEAVEKPTDEAPAKKTQPEEDVPAFTEEEIAQATQNAVENGTIRDRREVLAERQQRQAEREKNNEANCDMLSLKSQLQMAQRQNRLLEANVIGVSTLRQQDKAVVFVTANYENRVKVMIAFDDMYRENPLDMTTVNPDSDDYLTRQRTFCEKLFGLTIPFMIKQVATDKNNPSNFIVVGSRKAALKVIEHRNYDENANGKTLIGKGSMVDATVTSVSRYSIGMNVGGIDTTVPVRLLTFRYVDNPSTLSSMYHVGDTVTVEVTSVKTDEDGNHSIVVSARNGELADVKRKQQYLAPSLGEHCIGTITAIRPSKNNNNSIAIALYIDGYEMPAVSSAFSFTSLGYFPKLGDKVRVTVTGIAENGFAYVRCRQIIPQT